MPNPGRGGWGCYAIYHPESQHHSRGYGVTTSTSTSWSQYGGKKYTTNNEMELSGILMGLRFATISSDVTIFADTQYGLKGLLASGKSKEYLDGYIRLNKLKNDVVFTGWVKGWSQNGWKTASKEAVKNKQLWLDIMAECKRHVLGGSTLRFVWIKGHSGIEGNEMADELANRGVNIYT